VKEKTDINIVEELENIKKEFKRLSDENREIQQKLRQNQEESLKLQGVYQYLITTGKKLGIIKDIDNTEEPTAQN